MCVSSAPPSVSFPIFPVPSLTDTKPDATADHRLHWGRDPLFFVPCGQYERFLRQHARAVAGDDEPHVEDGGEDGRGVEGLAGVFRGGLVGFCLCLAVLRRGNFMVKSEGVGRIQDIDVFA